MTVLMSGDQVELYRAADAYWYTKYYVLVAQMVADLELASESCLGSWCAKHSSCSTAMYSVPTADPPV